MTRRTSTTERIDDRVLHARGGISPIAVVTGILVALGVLLVLGALLGGAVAASDVDSAAEAAREAGSNFTEAGIGAAVVLVMAQFLAYLWGGYTAGRMGRGSGWANGLLVPVGTMIVVSLTMAAATAMGAEPRLALPFLDARLPVDDEVIVRASTALGIASVIAMVVGGIVGGIRGAGWHGRLERRRLEQSGTIDLREGVLDHTTAVDTTADQSDDMVVAGPHGARADGADRTGDTTGSVRHRTDGDTTVR